MPTYIYENQCSKIQDGRQVDILDFVFQIVMQEQIGRLTWIILWVGLPFGKPVPPKIQDGHQVDIFDFALSSN
jgi:hypothetical protein